MAKIYGLFGAMTGKLADTVMTVRNGEQIARKYQPIVFNPSTPAQVAQRAKLKLLSQLSAVMTSVIAIPRQGAVSSRNIFTKLNHAITSYSNDTATIDLEKIKLTNSSVFLPTVTATRGAQITIALSEGDEDVDKVAYCIFGKVNDELRFVAAPVVDVPSVNNTFPIQYAANTASLQSEVLVLAYGIRLNNQNARAKYGNLEAPTAEDIAKLIVSKTLTESDVTLTETKGITMAAATQSREPEEEKKNNR